MNERAERGRITRRQWLRRVGALGAAAGATRLVGTASSLRTLRLAQAQGQPKRGGTLLVATVDKPVNMDPG